jgi:dTDP-4-amino-4,6-dideoxygalactose transaminase
VRAIPIQNIGLVNKRREIREAFEAYSRDIFADQSFIRDSTVKAFEQAYASYNDVSFCVGVNSGTDALEVALVQAGVESGQVVIIPSFTFIATAYAVSRIGAIPRFADVLSTNYTIDPDSVNKIVKELKQSKTVPTAIIAVNLFGHPCDYDSLRTIADSNSMVLIEDNAQAHGAKHNGVMCGAIGDLNATSFYPTKNLGGIGDGGALTVPAKRITHLGSLERCIREHCNLGLNGVNFVKIGNRHSRNVYSNLTDAKGSRNTRLDAIQAAFLLAKLPHLDKLNDERREVAAYYTKRLSKYVPYIMTPVPLSNTEPVWNQYVICTEDRERLALALENKGIGTKVYYDPCCHQVAPYNPAPKDRMYNPSSLVERREQMDKALPVTVTLSKKALALPCYPGLLKEDLEHVCDTIEEFAVGNWTLSG